MPRTLAEKVLFAHTDADDVTPGERRGHPSSAWLVLGSPPDSRT